MRSGARLFWLVLSCFLLLAASPETEQPLNGYSAATSRTQRDWETKFRALPEPQNQRDYEQSSASVTLVRRLLALQMSLANLARLASPSNIPNSNMEIDMKR